MATFDDLLSQYDGRIAAAFMEAIQSIRDQTIIARVVERLERRDIYGALEALQIDAKAFTGLEIALQEAFNSGGLGAVSELPTLIDADGARVIFRFGVRNIVGESILRSLSSTMVTRITDDQRQGLRYALEAGLARGANPLTTALDVAGRINPTTGRREGGLIGLTSRQIEFIERARANLASGDPALMRKYLDLGSRDKRFDRTVLAAIRDGKPVSTDMLGRIIARLNDRNLKIRANNIARTETMMALGSARHEALRQQIEDGKLAQSDVEKIWHSAGDSRVRHTHRVLNGKKVAFEATFESPSGARLRYPGDPNAPIAETSGCRCWCEYRINYIAAGLRKYRARTS